jgi:hypothetical protein
VEAGHVGLVKTFSDYAGTMQPGRNAKLQVRGEAQSIAIRGRALRENPEILQLEAINKLNPNVQTIYLPQGGNFIFNLPSGTAQ